MIRSPWLRQDVGSGPRLRDAADAFATSCVSAATFEDVLISVQADTILRGLAWLRWDVEYRLFSTHRPVAAERWLLAPDRDRLSRTETPVGVDPEHALDDDVLAYLAFRREAPSGELHRLVEAVVGRPLGPPVTSVSRIRPGHVVRPHVLRGGGMIARAELFLTPGWSQAHQGASVVTDAEERIVRLGCAFNSLAVANLQGEPALHVAPVVGAGAERTSITMVFPVAEVVPRGEGR